MVNRESLRKQIPHGYMSKIAVKAGVSAIAVSNYFAGRTNSRKVQNAALEVAAEIAKEDKALLNQLPSTTQIPTNERAA